MTTVTTAGPKGLFADQTFIPGEVVPEALILQLATIAGSVEGDTPVMRIPFVADDQQVGFVAEGQELDLGVPALDEVTVVTSKIALLTKMSREAYEYSQADQLVADSMARAIADGADKAFLANAPAAGKLPQSIGLLNTPGMLDAGELASNLDVLVDAITAVEANHGAASHLVTDPGSWATIQKMKTAKDANLPLVGAPAAQTGRVLLGVPVVVNPNVPAGTLLVIDKREIIAAVGDIRLDVSDQVYFSADSIGRRASWRFGWTVVHPKRLAKVAVPVPDEPAA